MCGLTMNYPLNILLVILLILFSDYNILLSFIKIAIVIIYDYGYLYNIYSLYSSRLTSKDFLSSFLDVFFFCVADKTSISQYLQLPRQTYQCKYEAGFTACPLILTS